MPNLFVNLALNKPQICLNEAPTHFIFTFGVKTINAFADVFCD